MSGVNRNPPADDTSIERISGFREVQLMVARENCVAEQEEERQLTELDDSIVGTNHRELVKLRARLRKD